MDELLAIAGQITFMSKEQYDDWKTENPGFVSLNVLYRNAVEDIQKLASNAEKSGHVDYELLNKFKDYYSGSLLFNDNPQDEELYNPYLPINNAIYGNVINKNGEVVIAGEKVDLREIEKVEDTWYYKAENQYRQTRAKDKTEKVEQKNRLYICNMDKKRKMWLEVVYFYHTEECAILCTSKAKSLIGWSDYPTQYHFNYISCDVFSWRYMPVLIGDILDTPDGELVTPSIPSGMPSQTIPLAPAAPNAVGLAQVRAWSNGVGPMSGVLDIRANKDNYIFKY